MQVEVTAALVGVTGVIVGAIAQFLFARRTDATKHFQELKSAAYTDFIKAIAGIAISQRRGLNEQEHQFTILLADAKARIAVYGKEGVVQKSAVFFRDFSALQSPEGLRAFIEIVQEMRTDTLESNEGVTDAEISQLLFGTK